MEGAPVHVAEGGRGSVLPYGELQGVAVAVQGNASQLL